VHGKHRNKCKQQKKKKRTAGIGVNVVQKAQRERSGSAVGAQRSAVGAQWERSGSTEERSGAQRSAEEARHTLEPFTLSTCLRIETRARKWKNARHTNTNKRKCCQEFMDSGERIGSTAMAPNAPGLDEELKTTSFNVCHKAEKSTDEGGIWYS